MSFSTDRPKRSIFFPVLLIGGLLTFSLVILFGATRAYFSSQRLQQELDKVLQKQNEVFVEVGNLKLVIVSDLIPRLGVQAENIKMIWLQDCRIPQVNIDRAVVQFSWLSLATGEVRLQPIAVSHLKMDMDELRDCSEQSQHIPRVAPGKKFSTSRSPGAESEKVEASMVSDSSLRKEAPLFDSLEIEKMTLKWKEQVLMFSELKTSPYYRGGGIDLTSKVLWELPGLMDYQNPRFNISAKLEKEKAEIEMDGKWGEGTIQFEGDWHGQLGGREVYQASVKMTNIPLSPISEVMNRYDIWKNPLPYKSVWLSCELQVTGDQSVQSGGVTMDDCLVSGELGKLKVPHIQLAFENNDLSRFKINQAFEIDLTQVSLRKILKVFQIDIMGGVLRSFGQLNGRTTIDVDGRTEFAGEIVGAAIGFSRNKKRGQQVVPKVAGRFSLAEGRVSGKLDELNLKDGEFDGGLSFNFDRHFTEGFFQLNVNRLLFSPSIQSLMVGGEFSPLSVFGKLIVEDNKVSRWEGQLGLDKVQREDLSLEKIKMKSTFNGKSQVLTLKTQAQAGRLSQKSDFYEWLKPIFLGYEFSDEISFRELKTRFEVKDRSWLWKKGQLRSEKGEIVISSEGQMSASKNLSGWVNVDFPDLKLVKWDLGGNLDNPRLVPNAKNMRALIRRSKSKKK